MQQVGGFLQALRFPPPIKLIAKYCWIWCYINTIKPTNQQYYLSCERTSQSKIVCSTCCMFFFFYYRKEIQATLERLKRAERNLTEKEQQLREREMKISEREKSLEQQFKVVVSFVDRCLSLWPFFFWPLCCLSCFDLLILITPLISSNSSYKKYFCFDIFMKRKYKQWW